MAGARSNSPETLERDVAVLRSLDTLWRSPLDVVLPEGLSRRLHEKGVSLLGLRTVFRFAVVALVSVVTILGIVAAEYSIRGFKVTESQMTRAELLDDVYFDLAKANLRDDARVQLTHIAAVLAPAIREDPRLSFVLEGYTSAEGAEDSNAYLGLRRAEAVKAFLVQQGLPGDQFTTESHGDLRCTQNGQQCRRVHFATVDAGETVTVPTSSGPIQETYVRIPKGTFQMGCSAGDNECYDDEKPVHTVTLTHDFYLAQKEVTVANYSRFAAQTKRQPAGKTSYSKSDQDPVVNVSWDDAQAYCAFVSGRLPTEAEWEYAARGGRPEARYRPLDLVAWYSDNSNKQLHPVRQKQPNAYGLYDMLGNAWEWTADWFGGYGAGALIDPQGPGSGTSKVVRGGGWYNYSRDARAADREYRYVGLGFRCLRPAP